MLLSNVYHRYLYYYIVIYCLKNSYEHKSSRTPASKKNTSNLTLEDKRAIKSINDYESIKIVPADERNTTVIIDTTDYNNKTDEHLSDQSI